MRCGCTPASILFHTPSPASAEPPAHEASVPPSSGVSLDDRLSQVEASLITWALNASHGNKSKAAELLQIKRSTLCDRIRKLQRNSGSAFTADSENVNIH